MQARRLGVIGLVVFTTATSAQQAQSLSLREVQQALAASRLVDLTHPFAPGIPHWPGFADEKRETLYWYEKGPGSIGSGFFAERFTHVGQWGMHVDPAVLVFQRAYSRSRRISQT